MRKLVALLALILLLGGCAVDVPGPLAGDVEPSVDLSQADAPPPRSDLADVIERVLPSVVNVRVSGIDCSSGADISGEGSGVVIDADGIILTNSHVVRGATHVEVVLNGQSDPLEGRVLGAVTEKDLAVVKVDAEDLTPIELGRSSRLRLGDDLVAIGFPLGLGGATVTRGIVSATDRTIELGPGEALEGLLQTDAAINPGNSGGALIDAAGRLVGINTAAAQASQAENIGFAIAIDTALPVIDEILTQPPGERAWLGVYLQAISSESDALRLGLPSGTRGVLIVDVFSGSPAASAGLTQGDTITTIEGEAITSLEDLTRALNGHDPGDVVSVTVVNASGDRTVKAKLEVRPSDEVCG